MSSQPIKHVFVTGACGFVGRHFCEWVETAPDWRAIPATINLDLRNDTSIARSLAALPVSLDAVLHLAAQSNVPQAFADPSTGGNPLPIDVNQFERLYLNCIRGRLEE